MTDQHFFSEIHPDTKTIFIYTILRSKPKYNLRKMCISQAASREQNNRVWRYESRFIVNTN